jgi:carbon storage regulator
MLVLRRKVDERIIIGDDIMIAVLAIEHGLVKIGIKAPWNVHVHREEIYRIIQEEKRRKGENRERPDFLNH